MHMCPPKHASGWFLQRPKSHREALSGFLIEAQFNYCFPHCWSNEVHMSSTLPPGLCSSPKCMTSVLSRWPEFARWVPFQQPGGL